LAWLLVASNLLYFHFIQVIDTSLGEQNQEMKKKFDESFCNCNEPTILETPSEYESKISEVFQNVELYNCLEEDQVYINFLNQCWQHQRRRSRCQQENLIEYFGMKSSHIFLWSPFFQLTAIVKIGVYYLYHGLKSTVSMQKVFYVTCTGNFYFLDFAARKRNIIFSMHVSLFCKGASGEVPTC
jgi:hypothetical protein